MACRTNRCGSVNLYSRCGYSEVSCGPKVIVHSYLIRNGKYRQVKFANGCCATLAKSWVPQNYNTVEGNGPIPLSRCAGGNIDNTASEGMDCMNGMFNSGVR